MNIRRSKTLCSMAAVILVACAGSPRAAQKIDVQHVNSDLKNDILDQPDDAKRIHKDRDALRDAYATYVETYKGHGHGSRQARRAARKVLALQSRLHKDLDREERKRAAAAAPPASEASSAAAPATGTALPDKEMPALPDDKGLVDDSKAAGDPDAYYQEIVKQYGADSPQARALRRQMDVK